METIQKHDRVNQLLGHYKPLLTPKQQRILEYYFEEDYSLAETAEILNISRNAVHDHIKKALEKMEDFDAVLQLTTLSLERSALIEALEKTDLTDAQKALLNQLKKVI